MYPPSEEVTAHTVVDHVAPAGYYEYSVINRPTAPPQPPIAAVPTTAIVAPTDTAETAVVGVPITEACPKNYATERVLVGPKALRVVCPHCKAEMLSKTKCTNSTRTHLMSVLFGITTCLWCLPYFFKSYKNVDHYCNACGMYLGTYYH